MSKQQQVLVISTGGTITMTGAAGSPGLAPTLTADDLLAAVPEMARLAHIEALTFSSVPGASLTFENLINLSRVIDERLAGDTAGAIVIQGTDTIEETAFLLGLLITSDKPVIVTGAMRGAQAAGADGPANLLASVIVAISSNATGRGPLVVLNDEVHSSIFVQKSHTALPSSFTSPMAGPVGLVYEHDVLFTSGPAARRLTLPRPSKMRPVAIVKAALDDDGRLLPTLENLGYAGVVIEAMGAGHVPERWVQKLTDLATRLPVVLAVRTKGGPVFTKTYGFPGSETDLLGRGLIPAGILDPLKARLLLSLLVSNDEPVERIRAEFVRFHRQSA
jgi:L-asparaginase